MPAAAFAGWCVSLQKSSLIATSGLTDGLSNLCATQQRRNKVHCSLCNIMQLSITAASMTLIAAVQNAVHYLWPPVTLFS